MQIGKIRVNPLPLLESSGSMRIFGKNLNFVALTGGLGVTPSHTHRSGDHSATGEPYPTDAWLLRSPLARSEFLDKHLDWLRNRLLPNYDFVHALMMSGEAAEVSSFCGLTVEAFECSFQLAPLALRLFVELGIEMELSLIFHDPTDSWKNQPPVETEVDISDPEPEQYRKEAEVYLRVLGDKIEPSAISDALKLQPLERLESSSHEYERRACSFAVRLPVTEPLDAHLKLLGNNLSRNSIFISSLKKEAEVAIVCNLSTECGWESFWLSAEAFRSPVELGLPLEFKVKLIQEPYGSEPQKSSEIVS